jgi:acetylornithine deacetylase
MRNHPPKVRFVGYGAEASEIPVDHPIVETLSRNHAKVAGKKPEISGRQGCS